MFWIEIIVFVLVFVIIFLVIDNLKYFKERHCSIKCGICGSLDTVIKNNDTFEPVYTFSRFYGVRDGNKKCLVHNPPTYFCNVCKKEYSCREGQWVKKIIPEKVEVKNEKSEN